MKISAESTKLYWIRGGTLRKVYIKFGDSDPLVKYVQFLSGARGAFERLVVRLFSMSPIKIQIVEEDILTAWTDLYSSLEPRAAFLLYTGYYKETVAVGAIVRSSGIPQFIKIFKNECDAREEGRRSEVAKSIAGSHFRCAKVIQRIDSIVVYEMLNRSHNDIDIKSVCAKVLTMCESNLFHSKDVCELSSFFSCEDDMHLADFGIDSGLRESILSVFHSKEKMHKVVAHGDLTPWNVFRSDDAHETFCLIDYERVDVYTPYYDYFHFHTQPLVLKGKIETVYDWVFSSRCGLRCSFHEIRLYYLAYIAMQLKIDLDSWFCNNNRHIQLDKMIRAKALLLHSICKLSDQ